MKNKKKKNSKLNRIKTKLKSGLTLILIPMKELLTSGPLRGRTKYAYFYKHLKVKKNTILYESFLGRNFGDTPYAIFMELKKTDIFFNYTHIIVIKDKTERKRLQKEYKQWKNVKVILSSSLDYLKYLASAHYLFNNFTFPSYFTKKIDQIYTNSWHGIPLKSIGYDVPDGIYRSNNAVRDFFQTDYMISANSFLAEKYLTAYTLSHLYTGKIINEGYPRNDMLFSEKDRIITKLQSFAVDIKNKKSIILYAPTWKGMDFSMPEDDIEEMILFKSKLETAINTEKYQILIKPHYTLFTIMKEKYNNLNYIVPTEIDANEVLSITDILISDYSSIFYDFLTTNRPIIFYITDAKQYQDYRGLYTTLEKLPAPYTDNPLQVAEWINSIKDYQKNTEEKYLKVRDFCEHLDCSNISKKIIDIVFLNKKEGYKLIENTTKKKNILIFAGNLAENRKNQILLDYTEKINYDKYDVTIYILKPNNEKEQEFTSRFNKNIRFLVRRSTYNATLTERILTVICNKVCFSKKFTKKYFPKEAFDREIQRCFSGANYDFVLNYEGCDRYYALLFSQFRNTKTGILLESNMKTLQKTKSYFHFLLTVYPHYDKIISLDPKTHSVNMENLSTEEMKTKFSHLTHLLDVDDIESQINDAKYVVIDHIEYFVDERSEKIFLIPLEISEKETFEIKKYNTQESIDPVQDKIREKYAQSELFQLCSPEQLRKKTSPKIIYQMSEELQNNFFSNSKSWKNGILEGAVYSKQIRLNKTVKFVTLGEFTGNENHLTLMNAFLQIQKEIPNVMLFIIGHGVKFKEEYNFVIKNKMENHIILTGNTTNPMGIMKKCDCFIQPSFSDKSNLNIFKARTLNMPIIALNYLKMQSDFEENAQMIIGSTQREFYNGIKAYLQGEVPCDYHFDVEEYNRKCIEEFMGIFK